MDSEQYLNLYAKSGNLALQPASDFPSDASDTFSEGLGSPSTAAFPPHPSRYRQCLERNFRSYSGQAWVDDKIASFEAVQQRLIADVKTIQGLYYAIKKHHDRTVPTFVPSPASLTSPVLPILGEAHGIGGDGPGAGQYSFLQDVEVIKDPQSVDKHVEVPAVSAFDTWDEGAINVTSNLWAWDSKFNETAEVLYSPSQGAIQGITSSAELTFPTFPWSTDTHGSGQPKFGLDAFNLSTPPSRSPLCGAHDPGAGHVQPDSNTFMTLPANNEVITRRSPTYVVVVSDNVKKYRCECGHKTTRKGDMDRHHESLRHLQRRKYECSCGAGYTRKCALKRHMGKCRRQKF